MTQNILKIIPIIENYLKYKIQAAQLLAGLLGYVPPALQAGGLDQKSVTPRHAPPRLGCVVDLTALEEHRLATDVDRGHLSIWLAPLEAAAGIVPQG